MKAQDVNVGHALIHIFIGADLVTRRFDASPKPPTINDFPDKRTKALIKALEDMGKESEKAPNAFRDDCFFKFVGDPLNLTPNSRTLPRPSELGTQADVAAAWTTRDPMMDKSLETDFNLTVSLMGSESQFQAIKQYMTEKAKEKSPEELRAQAMLVVPMAARFFLEVNFPNCKISDEGPFPVILPDGTETVDEDARLLVARDPKQEPSSIVAAINVVPLPNSETNFYSDKNWLETSEMKEADERLLLLLKRLYKQGKVSRVDCMAQTMMVKDVTIYKLVDGERFEDYSDERVAQFKWGWTE